MNKSLSILGGLAVLVLGLFLWLNAPVTPASPASPAPVAQKKYGSLSGPDISYTYLSVNGVTHHYVQQDFNVGHTATSSMNFTSADGKGTTTVCSLPVPSNMGNTSASTTIVQVGAIVNGISTTTGAINIFKGIGKTSTTTELARLRVTATSTVVRATSTVLDVSTAVVGEVNEYIVFDYQGANWPYLGINGKTGSCSAEFIEY